MVHYSGSIEYSRRWDRRVYPVPRCHKVVCFSHWWKTGTICVLSLSSSSLCKLVFLTADSLFYLNIFQPPTTVINSARKKIYDYCFHEACMCILPWKVYGIRSRFRVRSARKAFDRTNGNKTGDWLAYRNVQVLKSRWFIDVSYEDKERTMCGQKSADKTGSK